MKYNVQRLLPAARQAIQDVGIAQDGKVPTVFKGYFASFGASLVQAGLLPTVIFFEGENNAEGDRSGVCRAILLMWEREERNNSSHTLPEKATLHEFLLEKYANEDRVARERALQRALTRTTRYAIALKIALRTFQFTQKETRHEPSTS